jgi:tagatose 6-phosphate kinase
VEAALCQAGVPSALIPISGPTRHTFAVVDDAGTTASFNEAGPGVTAHEFDSLRMAYLEALATADAVVLSGSLPPGLPVTTYAALIQAAAAAGVPVLLDSNGAALLQGVSAGPAIVKPNLDELAGATGKVLSLWAERLRHAVALAAAAVAAPVAGEFRQERYVDGLHPVAVRLEEVH